MASPDNDEITELFYHNPSLVGTEGNPESFILQIKSGNPSSSTSTFFTHHGGVADQDWVFNNYLISGGNSIRIIDENDDDNDDDENWVRRNYLRSKGNGDNDVFRNGENDPSCSSSTNINPPQHANTDQSWLDLNCNQPLYHAALRGDWEAAKKFLQANPIALTARITRYSMTALHVAACEGHSDFVEKLVQLMPVEALEMGDEFGRTALHYAAFSGILKAAIALVKKNPNLTSILDGQGWTPLLRACLFGFAIDKDLIWYLFLVTKDDGPGRPFTGPFAPSSSKHLLDLVILYLLQHYPELATVPVNDSRPRIYLLSLLALTPMNFLSCSRLGFWERLIYSFIPIPKTCEPPEHVKSIVDNPVEGSRHLSQADLFHWLRRLVLWAIRRMTPSIFKRLQDAKVRHHCAVELVTLACKRICELHGSLLWDHFDESLILESAARNGITEIVKIMLQFCPDLLWATKSAELFMLHTAIEHRREEIFNLLCKTNAHLKFTSGQTLLHRVAKLVPHPQLSTASSPALQMQRELQWFKAVEKLMNPTLKILEDKNGRTPGEIFTKEHKTLAEAGEKWMKDTSNSCMIVSTLIATFVFAAAFTVPGGNDEKGLPIFLWSQSFLVFVISDALALFSSITSLLMFFSILTARYAEEDFLVLLPKKLIIGLASLFFSIATMMVAFGATLYIVLSKRLHWVAIPIILLASVPVSIFALLQFPLFIEMYRSTFGNRYMFRPQSIW